jgi:hypothetical protein
MNSKTGKTFNVYDFLPAVQFGFGFSKFLNKFDLNWDISDLFVPSFSSGLSFSIFQKINATLPGEVCRRMGCRGF